MATPPAAPSLNLWAVLSESKRIINAHSRHFLALSVIFLLPFSFSLIVSPTLFYLLIPSINSRIHILLRQTQTQTQTQTPTPTTPSPFPFPFPFPFPLPLLHHQEPIDPAPFFFSLLFFLFLFLLSLCAVATITHSVFHGFFGRPVKLHSAITSILPSFSPLLATALASHLVFFSLSLLFALFSFLLLQAIRHLGIAVSFSSPFFLAFSAVLFLALLFALVYLRVSWTLASVIVVAESSWGLEPLRRSATLMKGMKGVGASSLLFFGFMEGVLLWTSLVLVMGSDGTTGGGVLWKDWAFVVQIVLTSTMLMLLLLYHTAANTVLYMYCKAVHGELAVEIADEFAREYVSLPFDDGKVPHVVSVVHVV